MTTVAEFRRRLNETQRFTGLPAQSRYYLAASDLDDDTLERAGEPFGAPYGESGFGTSEVLTELMSRDPKYIRVNDLQSYQESLKTMGYLPSSYAATGSWDDQSAAAQRRADRDAFNTTKAGGGYLSAPAKTLFRYLGYTVPTPVFEGVYGIATGIVEDAVRFATHPVEVAEEGGVAGTAAVGAGIGALIAGIPTVGIGAPVGAAIGGAIGAVAGFFGGFFDDDNEEQGSWERIVDALTPIDEIKSGDAKNLFAALSTVMTASAILKAGAVATQGVRAAGVTGLNRSAFKMAARGSVEPGLAGQLTRAALKRPVLGSAALGGVIDAAPELFTGDSGEAFKDFGRGALIGAVAGPLARRTKLGNKAVDKALEAINAAPLARIAASPAGKVTQALYTGVTTPTIVARATAELSGKSGTAVGRQMLEAPDLGTAGTVLDWTLGAVIYPERFIPWKGKDVTAAMKTLGSNHELLPFSAAARKNADNTLVSQRVGMERARQALGRDVDGTFNPLLVGVRSNFAYLNKGVDDAAEAAVKSRPRKKGELVDPFDVEVAMNEERSKLIATIREEAGAKNADNIVSSPTASRLINEAKSNPASMQNYIERIEGRGSTLDNFAQHQQAEEFLQTKTTALLEGKEASFTPAVRGQFLTRQDFERVGGKTGDVGDYEAAATRYKQAFDTALEGPENAHLIQARTDAGEELDKLLVDMKTRGMIDERTYSAARPGVGVEPVVSRKLIKYLQDTAPKRPREIPELSKDLADAGMNRYIAVATGDDMIHYSHFLKQAEISGLTEYSRRDGFWDSLASLGAKTDRADLGAMRFNSIVRHLDNTVDDLGLSDRLGDGKAVADKIYDELKLRYDPDFAKRRGEKLEVKYGSIIRREKQSGETTRELFKIDPRDLTPDDIVTALKLDEAGVLEAGQDAYEVAHRIKRSLHVGAAFGADIAHPIATARAVAASIKTNGFPGFNDFMRTTTIVPTRFAIKSNKFKKGSYGYLPQTLRRAHMAVQFSLSPTFDASRYAEAMMFGKMRGGDIPIKAATNPKGFVRNHEEGWVSPLHGQRVEGEEAVKEMVEFGDRVLYGRAANQNFDELQLRLLHRGVLGFKPREVEYAQAWWLAQKKVRKGPLSKTDMEEIRETVMQIGQYGTKQTAAGNSLHFVFFPYLFSKKQLSAMVDYTLGAPTRNLLVHEGFRRWYEIDGDESISSKFADFMETHIPLAKELERINNLAYGISPGRFFLEGIMDKPTEGKVAQALTSFFLPGGVHQPIADTVSAATSMALRSRLSPLKQFFVPQVWVDDGSAQSGEQGDFLDLAERLIPAYRDFQRWFTDQEGSGDEHGLIGAQVTALSGKGAPYAQMSSYLDLKKVMGQALESKAQSLGYSSWESLRGADPTLAKAVNDIDLALGEMFPQGKDLANRFVNSTELKEQVLYKIDSKDGPKTSAENAVSIIGQVEVQMKDIAAQQGRTQEEMLRMAAPLVRAFALGYSDDRQFMNLWDEMFKSYYGPLRVVQAA